MTGITEEAVGPRASLTGRGQRREASERRRRQILDAARGCFGSLGFARATVETIAAEAGVSNGLLYQFFRNKQHLFEVVVEELLKDWRRASLSDGREGSDGPRSPADAIARMLRGSVEFARNNPLLPALMTDDAVLELSRFSDLGGRWSEGHREYVADLLRAGVERGEFRADLAIESAADVICQLQVDYSTRAYRGDGALPAGPDRIDGVVRFVLDAVRA